ncbi:DUF4197 domain-containing protein [Parerythrobacter jejuensis]|uniref:DUF4197 family protein n=1 Tax=Parerythrobacter jejuensis TaxID=795812 RepID=A0A845AS64_9SPHN|nr:DUF4197 domain-containing protein [Parerythrobacter jejuensis]MXP31681.1 DUF4197 family protein [Parerythrobacter jejuensis]
MNEFQTDRRLFLGGAAAATLAIGWSSPAFAQGIGLSSILGRASDSALDKLAQPGAFYNDEDVRIGLPFLGGNRSGVLGSILGGASRLGILDGFIRSLNSAAGTAAGEAKPIFRDAIDGLSFNDVPGIVRQNDGGTRYLRESSNDRLHGKLEPLIDTALGDLGAHGQLERLNSQHSWMRSAGLDRARLNKTVTDQGLDGIFSYIGREETNFRSNPLGNAGKALKDIF